MGIFFWNIMKAGCQRFHQLSIGNDEFLGHPSGHHWRGLFSHHIKPDVPNEKSHVADVLTMFDLRPIFDATPI